MDRGCCLSSCTPLFGSNLKIISPSSEQSMRLSVAIQDDVPSPRPQHTLPLKSPLSLPRLLQAFSSGKSPVDTLAMNPLCATSEDQGAREQPGEPASNKRVIKSQQGSVAACDYCRVRKVPDNLYAVHLQSLQIADAFIRSNVTASHRAASA
jgi:hypothetical protein